MIILQLCRSAIVYPRIIKRSSPRLLSWRRNISWQSYQFVDSTSATLSFLNFCISVSVPVENRTAAQLTPDLIFSPHPQKLVCSAYLVHRSACLSELHDLGAPGAYEIPHSHTLQGIRSSPKLPVVGVGVLREFPPRSRAFCGLLGSSSQRPRSESERRGRSLVQYPINLLLYH
jgi:hypothetical protein